MIIKILQEIINTDNWAEHITNKFGHDPAEFD